MLKIFCLLAALLVSAACKIDRPNRVVEEKKVVEPVVVNQSSSGANSPNIVKGGGKVTVTYAPGGPDIGDDLTPEITVPAHHQYQGFITKTQARELGYGDGTQNLLVTRRIGSPFGVTVWKSGHTPNSWEAVLYIKEH